MDIQPLTLEELVEDATDISNFASNDAQARAVSNQVNRTIGGAHTVIKLLIQKIGMRQEVVTLQALNVVEVCVKNCGSPFHNEIGKYKFINELIKLLSSKYDGDITPQSVKERVICLMFSWYVGLPQETKIGEAYKMLKQQGIVKRDPVDPNRLANQPLPRENENTAFQDEGNTKLLKTLLSSKDAEDLHSANKLIKNMVKEEEDRLDRVSKRIQVLETVANNVKLLDDMIAKYEPKTNESGLEIMNDLYERCLTLRPELFRLASKNVDDQDDSVGEILSASDELTRVIDSYKEQVLFKKPTETNEVPASRSETSDLANTTCLLDLDLNSPTDGSAQSVKNSLLDEQFKLLGLSTPVSDAHAQPPPVGMSGFSYMQTNWNINPANTGTFQDQRANPVRPMYSCLPSSSNMLPNNSAPILRNPNTMPAFSNVVRPAVAPPHASTSAPNKDLFDFDVFDADFLKPSNNSNISNANNLNRNMNKINNSTEDQLLSLDPQTTMNVPSIIASNKGIVTSTLPVSETFQAAPIVQARQEPTTPMIPSHVVTHPPVTVPTAVAQPAPIVPAPTAVVHAPIPVAYAPVPVVPAPVPVSPASVPVAVHTPVPVLHAHVPVAVPTLPTPAPVATPAPVPVTITVAVPTVSDSPANPAAVPVQVLNTQPAAAVSTQPAAVSAVNYLVPLDALKPGKYDPIPILDKDGLKTFLILAEDTRDNANPNVIVSILSTISLNTNPVTSFSIQVAVPKVMRVKLQPPTATELASFNPIFPPPTISQVMLIANPTKETVKLRFKIVYVIGGASHVETANIDDLPAR